jgi:hypothetical protein
MSVPVGVTAWTPCATPWPSARQEMGADCRATSFGMSRAANREPQEGLSWVSFEGFSPEVG